MTTTELNDALLRELSTIASDEGMIKQVIDYIRRLRRNHAKEAARQAEPYTIEELNARIDRTEKNYAEGRYTGNEEVQQEITELLSSL